MNNIQTQVSNPKPHIPAYLPLVDAVQKYGLSEKVLTRMIQAGKIGAVQLPSWELLVAAERNGQKPRTKDEIVDIHRQLTHLV